jgi:IclR family mhp operon transcriptional activator
MVEPHWSNTIAAPITVNRRVLATVGMTYFTSALDRAASSSATCLW